MVHTTSLMTQRTSRSHCVSMVKSILMCRALATASSQYHVMVFVCFFASSGLRTPLNRDGNEIQEIWEINACWHYVWAKVRVKPAQHVEKHHESFALYIWKSARVAGNFCRNCLQFIVAYFA